MVYGDTFLRTKELIPRLFDEHHASFFLKCLVEVGQE